MAGASSFSFSCTASSRPLGRSSWRSRRGAAKAVAAVAVKPRQPHAQRGDSGKAGAALAAQKLTVEAASQRQWWGDNPALQQQITAAANAYFDNPESLTITAQPAEPVPFAQIMGIGATDPRQLVDLLDVKVTAND